MLIRTATPADFDVLGQIMFEAIHDGDSPYTAAQRRAWLPAPPGGAGWSGKLAAQIVVLSEDNAPTGFMTLEPGGYLDLAFIHPEARGRGLFRALCQRIEAEARALGLSRLTTHASLLAQRPFAAMGFSVVHHEQVPRGDEWLARAEMTKTL